VSDAGLSGHQAHLCNNPEPNLELTVNGPDRPLRFGATIVTSTKKKAAADAAAFHDPDNLAAAHGLRPLHLSSYQFVSSWPPEPAEALSSGATGGNGCGFKSPDDAGSAAAVGFGAARFFGAAFFAAFFGAAFGAAFLAAFFAGLAAYFFAGFLVFFAAFFAAFFTYFFATAFFLAFLPFAFFAFLAFLAIMVLLLPPLGSIERP